MPDEVEQLERAHRVRRAELHAGVDLLRLDAGPLEQPDRVEQVGEEQPVDDEAGLVRHLDGGLADRLAEGGGAARACRRRASSGKHSSTSFIFVTGLKTCRPKKRAGSPLARGELARCSATTSCVASRRLGGQRCRRSDASSSRLTARSSRDRLDRERGAARAVEVGRDGRACRRSSDGSRLARAPAELVAARPEHHLAARRQHAGREAAGDRARARDADPLGKAAPAMPLARSLGAG